jgi:flagellar basal-body rod modification protein FlgD
MVDAINGVTSQAVTAPSVGNNATVDYEAFLTLLIAQMKNQDPTEPMDATQYMSQLASFSNVEQSVQIKEQLELILQTSYLDQASGLIGKTLTSPDGEVSGEISQVQVFGDGIIATLTGGEQVLVSNGVTIS